VREEYGLDLGSGQANTGASKDEAISIDEDGSAAAGGFMPEHDENDFGGGFLVDHEEDIRHGSDLEMDAPMASQEQLNAHEDVYDQVDASQEYPTPMSAFKTRAAIAKAKANGRRSIDEHVVADGDDSDRLDMSDADQTLANEEPNGEAGGFLMDDDESNGHADQTDFDKSAPHNRVTDSAHGSSSSPEEEEEYTSQPVPPSRGRGRPRKSAVPTTTMRTPTSRTAAHVKPTSGSTRKTPARSAKSNIPYLNTDGAADTSDSASEPTTQVDSDLSDSPPPSTKPHATKTTMRSSAPAKQAVKAKPAPPKPGTSSKARGRPPKKRSTDDEKQAATPVNGKRLLRKESTVVRSPYFEQE